MLNELIDNVAFVGTLDDIDKQVDKLRSFANAGLGSVSLRLYADPAESIRLIGERVVPALLT